MQSLFPRLRQLILPFFALPNDPAIIIGPDLPPCMQARYSAAIFFRPPNTVTGGIHGGIWSFKAQRKAQASTEEGYLLYDQTTVCGFVVAHVLLGANDTFGNIGVLEQFTPQFAGGSSAYVPDAFKWQIVGNATSGLSATMLIGDLGTNPNLTPFLIDGVAADRGLRAQASSTVNSAAVGAEAVVLTTGAFTAYNNRAYKWKILNHLVGSVAGANANAQVRLVNLAGAVLGFVSIPMAAAGPFYWCAGEGYFRRTAGTDLVGTNLVQTILTTAGTVTAFGGATGVRSIEVYDVGAAGDFPNAIAI